MQQHGRRHAPSSDHSSASTSTRAGITHNLLARLCFPQAQSRVTRHGCLFYCKLLGQQHCSCEHPDNRGKANTWCSVYSCLLQLMPSLQEICLKGCLVFHLDSVLLSLCHLLQHLSGNMFANTNHVNICPSLCHLIIDGAFFNFWNVCNVVDSRSCRQLDGQIQLLEKLTLKVSNGKYHQWGKWDTKDDLKDLEVWLKKMGRDFALPTFELVKYSGNAWEYPPFDLANSSPATSAIRTGCTGCSV